MARRKQNGNGTTAASISPTITDVEQNAFWKRLQKKREESRRKFGEYLMPFTFGHGSEC